VAAPAGQTRLAARIEDALPQTQCTRCGFPDCRGYAEAIAFDNAAKRMHTVIDALCTGCELCIPVCPVDCIAMIDVTSPAVGWQAWSAGLAAVARERYDQHKLRLAREQREHDLEMAQRAARKLVELEQHSRITDPAVLEAKRAVVAAALARARAARAPARASDESQADPDA